jgi:3-methylcrotonyl-CoA carboxylase alpha subunit
MESGKWVQELMKLIFNDIELDVSSNGKLFTLTLDGETIHAEVLHEENGKVDLLVDGKHITAYVSSDNAKRWVTVNGQTFVLVRSSGARRAGQGSHQAAGDLTAPMPGQIRAVNVREGEAVTKGQTLLVVEAMKMEIRVHAPFDGVVASISVEAGQTVEREQILVKMEHG